jgi:MtfA peptidase
VDRNVRLWADLEADERANATEALGAVLAKRFEAARGFEIDDEIRVTIAAHAALLAIALDLSCFDDVPAIIVHPTTLVIDRPRGTGIGAVVSEGAAVIGVAHDRRGPVLLAWDAVTRDSQAPERGRNVVLHEFAHKLDLMDRVIDGTPAIDGELRDRWVRACTTEFDALRRGEPSVLDRYGATNPGEFFAVATEAFFCVPAALADGHPELYDVLAEFYGQDPADRPSAR